MIYASLSTIVFYCLLVLIILFMLLFLNVFCIISITFGTVISNPTLLFLSTVQMALSQLQMQLEENRILANKVTVYHKVGPCRKRRRVMLK